MTKDEISQGAAADRFCNSVFDSFRLGVQQHDCRGIITYSNHAHHRMLGYDDGELIGRRISDFQPTRADKQSLDSYFEKLTVEQPEPVPFSTRNMRKDGTIIDLQVDWNYLRTPEETLVGFISIITDITQQKQRHESLDQYSRGLAALLDVSRRLVSTLELEKILQSTSDGVSTLIGLRTAAIYLVEGTRYRLWATTPPLPPDFPDSLRLSLREDHPHLEKAISTGEPVLIQDTTVAHLSAEEQAVVKQRNLHTLLFLPLRTDVDVLGALIVGSIGEPIVLSKDKIRVSATFANIAAMAVKNARLYQSQQHYSRRLEQSMHEQRVAEEEREALREELFQMQKMEAVGRLAGGIAHDFNNQLGGIMGFAELLEDGLTDDRQRKLASNIISLAGRSADLTAQLLAFARKGQRRRVSVDIHAVVDEVVSILDHTTRRRITIQSKKNAAVSHTVGDPTQIQSALLNLALNADDAMPDGGSLTFETNNVELKNDTPDGPAESLAPGSYLQLSITDTGTGIDENVLPHIFEPFFTTKAPGRGTGMGLAAVYGTMKTHGGSVRVNGTPGHGTTFSLYFPVGEASWAVSANEQPAVVSSKGHEILVVDDEEMIVSTVSAHLTAAGYTVHGFTAADKALDYFKQHTSLSLVILDMIMPGMDGSMMFHALQAVQPSVRVLIISGFSPPDETRRLLGNDTVEFLHKPFQRKELLDAVARMLAI